MIPASGPFQYNPGAADAFTPLDGGGLLPDVDFPDDVFAAPQPAGPVVPRPAPRPAAKLTRKSLVEQAKERIAELKLELAEMANLQAEHDELERLVAAAENTSSK